MILQQPVVVQHGDKRRIAHGLAQHADTGAHAHFLGGLHDLATAPVHVVEEDRAGLDHFEDGEAGAGVDVLVGEARLDGPDVVA